MGKIMDYEKVDIMTLKSLFPMLSFDLYLNAICFICSLLMENNEVDSPIRTLVLAAFCIGQLILLIIQRYMDALVVLEVVLYYKIIHLISTIFVTFDKDIIVYTPFVFSIFFAEAAYCGVAVWNQEMKYPGKIIELFFEKKAEEKTHRKKRTPYTSVANEIIRKTQYESDEEDIIYDLRMNTVEEVIYDENNGKEERERIIPVIANVQEVIYDKNNENAEPEIIIPVILHESEVEFPDNNTNEGSEFVPFIMDEDSFYSADHQDF